MRPLIAICALLAVGGCASGPEANGDVATYDTLRTARADCEAKGGTLVVVPQGNPERMSAYECKRKPAP